MICALVAPESGVYSETFVRDHIERLPCNVLPLLGDLAGLGIGGQRIVPRALRFAISGKIPELYPFAIGSAHRWLARFLRREKVDVILAEYATTAAWLVDSALMASIPLVVHCHGYDVFQTEIVDANRAAYEKLFEHAAGFVVGSTGMRAEVIRLGARPDRVHYNPCGVDIQLFQPAPVGDNPPVIVAVGRFVEKKAPWATILAFDRALARCPEAKLIMAGEGPLLSVCRQMAAALGISGSVTFAGKQDHAGVATLLRGARAFAQHSVRAGNGDSEGTAISVLEASASGLPVIATAHGGIRDTVLHGLTGLLGPEFDIERMAEHMSMVLSDAGLAAKLGRRGRERVEAQFSMVRSIGDLQGILEQSARV